MRILIPYIILFSLIVGCAGEVETQDPIDFEDFAGETGILENDSVNMDTIQTLDLTSYSGRLMNAFIEDYSADTNETFHIMDRYSSSSSEKFKLSKNDLVDYGNNKVTAIAELFYYTFSDTNKTNNAFYNYLDDLSANGESEQIRLNEEVDHLKTPPLFMVVYDTVIVAANLSCEHQSNNWQPLKDSILSIYGKNYKYFIDVQCGGPLRWK